MYYVTFDDLIIKVINLRMQCVCSESAVEKILYQQFI
jgi:hypothetical protein